MGHDSMIVHPAPTLGISMPILGRSCLETVLWHNALHGVACRSPVSPHQQFCAWPAIMAPSGAQLGTHLR